MRHYALLIFFLILFTGCIHLRPPLVPIHKTDRYPHFEDMGSAETLQKAAAYSLESLSKINSDTEVAFGNQTITIQDLKETLSTFFTILEASSNPEEMNRNMRKNFDLYEISVPVLFTGYYEPLLDGSLVQTERFRYPLYRRPEDLTVKRKTSCLSLLPFLGRDRPYFSREEIDTQKVLSGRDLELIYLEDPIERFFLHVQGAGTVRLTDGRYIHVQYDGSNGRPYTSIGKVLIDEKKLTPEDVNLPRIKKYLRSHPNDQERIMNRNDRYIFFQSGGSGSDPIGVRPYILGVNNIPLTPLRSCATDPAIIPTGSLLYYITEFPSKKYQTNYAISQDIGNAIKGPDRVDIFLGQGPNAEAVAGHLKSKGKLFILLRK